MRGQFTNDTSISISWVYKHPHHSFLSNSNSFQPFHLLQKWDENSKLFENMILSNLILIAFTVILIVCEPGERVTNQFEQFGVNLDQCKWNKLPIEMQRIYLIFLSDAQQPKYIRSYGGIVCTRETFKQACILVYYNDNDHFVSNIIKFILYCFDFHFSDNQYGFFILHDTSQI